MAVDMRRVGPRIAHGALARIRRVRRDVRHHIPRLSKLLAVRSRQHRRARLPDPGVIRLPCFIPTTCAATGAPGISPSNAIAKSCLIALSSRKRFAVSESDQAPPGPSFDQTGPRQSQNSPPLGNLAKSPASWHRKAGTPLRSICLTRIRDIVIALVLQSHGIGAIFSNPSR
jgi:hypothetical protein